MVFTSPVFLFLFFPAVLLGYWIASVSRSVSVKNAVLLAGSMVFYAYSGLGYLLLLVFSIVVNWFLGCRMDSAKRCRKLLFLTVVIFNLAILVVFKYLMLILNTWNQLGSFFLSSFIPVKVPEIALPVGISFFTFQILSYQIDLYMGKVQCQYSLKDLALYVFLFPQLIAGPIVRYRDVEREISERKTDMDSIYCGLHRFMLGFSKKILIANTMGKAADLVFAMEGSYGFVYGWIGSICYSLQLYFDFWAYSDMAIGIGRIFGFHFLENFNHPYTSESMTEFWRRWHISLSTWFRDYVYIPLGGSREGLGKNLRNLMIVFALTGIWHGADWTFLVWGLYHGVFLAAEKLGLKRILEQLPSFVRRVYSLLVVCIGFVLFRADTFAEGINVLRNCFCLVPFMTHDRELLELVLTWKFAFFFLMAILFSTRLPEIFSRKLKGNNLCVILDLCVLACFLISICEMIAGGFNPFIYFRF